MTATDYKLLIVVPVIVSVLAPLAITFFARLFMGLNDRNENHMRRKSEEFVKALDGLLHEIDATNSEVNIMEERVSRCEHGIGRLESSLDMDLRDMDYRRICKIEQKLCEIEKEIKNG